MDYNDGSQFRIVTDFAAHIHERSMFEFRACSARNGKMYVDTAFWHHRTGLCDMTCLVMYQFPYQNAGSPEAQSDFFCDTVGSLRPNEAVMLDTESRGELHDPAEFALRWCARTEARLGGLCMTYVPRALANELHPGITGPRLRKAPRFSGGPGPGPAPDWPHDIWQYTDRGHFPGCTHPDGGDVNRTELTAEQVLARCRSV